MRAPIYRCELVRDETTKVPEICTTVDLAAKRIVIDPPEGLLEINR